MPSSSYYLKRHNPHHHHHQKKTSVGMLVVQVVVAVTILYFLIRHILAWWMKQNASTAATTNSTPSAAVPSVAESLAVEKQGSKDASSDTQRNVLDCQSEADLAEIELNGGVLPPLVPHWKQDAKPAGKDVFAESTLFDFGKPHLTVTAYLASWCGHSRKFVDNQWSKLQDNFKNVKNITFETIYCDKLSEADKKHTCKDIMAYPTVMSRFTGGIEKELWLQTDTVESVTSTLQFLLNHVETYTR